MLYYIMRSAPRKAARPQAAAGPLPRSAQQLRPGAALHTIYIYIYICVYTHTYIHIIVLYYGIHVCMYIDIYIHGSWAPSIAYCIISYYSMLYCIISYIVLQLRPGAVAPGVEIDS